VEVDVQVEGAAKALHEDHGAAAAVRHALEVGSPAGQLLQDGRREVRVIEMN